MSTNTEAILSEVAEHLQVFETKLAEPYEEPQRWVYDEDPPDPKRLCQELEAFELVRTTNRDFASITVQVRAWGIRLERNSDPRVRAAGSRLVASTSRALAHQELEHEWVLGLMSETRRVLDGMTLAPRPEPNAAMIEASFGYLHEIDHMEDCALRIDELLTGIETRPSDFRVHIPVFELIAKRLAEQSRVLDVIRSSARDIENDGNTTTSTAGSHVLAEASDLAATTYELRTRLDALLWSASLST